MMPVIQFAVVAFLIISTVFVFGLAILAKYNLTPQVEWPSWLTFVIGKINVKERRTANRPNITLKITGDLLEWSISSNLIPSLMEGQGYMVKSVRKAHGLYIKETGPIPEGTVFVYGLGGETTYISDSVITSPSPSSSRRTHIQILTTAA